MKRKENISQKFELLPDGSFVIENYNLARPFSSFFPGIAGLNGVPMWGFYTNRGQGISSFGVKNKNYPIMEFFPANNSYALTPKLGFRTFIRLKKGGRTVLYEPFCDNSSADGAVSQKMYVKPHEIAFEDINTALGLKVVVRYFTLPHEPIAALVRTVRIESIHKSDQEILVIDGLPKIIPYWIDQWVQKSMSYTAQAWAVVENLENNVPFYKLKVEIGDRPEVTELSSGNFFMSFIKNEHGSSVRLPVIVDPEIIFGQDQSFSEPRELLKNSSFSVPKNQFGNNKYPSAFSCTTAIVSAAKPLTIYSLTGYIGSRELLNDFARKVSKQGFIERKSEENKFLIETVTDPMYTFSNNKAFDQYCRQTYLDNLLRGGTPVIIPTERKDIVFYVYSRKHGDPERDYNNFELSPTFYSQGNGSFRDMNQNKRSDIFFTPKIGDFNVQFFFNLIQLDGYNPLVIKGQYFRFNPESKQGIQLLQQSVEQSSLEKVKSFFKASFEPGSLMLFLVQEKIELKSHREDFIIKILDDSASTQEAEHGEGFWTDHWTYNLDLLESYLAIYPEKEKEIIFEQKNFSFYDNTHKVMPRSQKQVNYFGKIRQFGSVKVDPKKTRIIYGRSSDPHVVRTRDGKGEIYKTTLSVKLLSLILNKLSSLDPDGIGIEMEADKPSWYDALNGLPGVFGSSVPETFELKRVILYMVDRIKSTQLSDSDTIEAPVEIAGFLKELVELFKAEPRISTFHFWDRASNIKESYRLKTHLGVSGKETSITIGSLKKFFVSALNKIEKGLLKAIDPKTGLYYTYFRYEAMDYKDEFRFNHKKYPCVAVTKFKRVPLPLFLESEVHYMKTEQDIKKVKTHYAAVKKSPLFDTQLKMYKVNTSLNNEPMDIGRCTVFSPGWLENESIWLHMEYKYLLELLRAGLYREFFNDFRSAGICFQDPSRYGRSILENSSFIASSAFPDKNRWGQGFVARLSGSTAEFIQMWIMITTGEKPFSYDHGALILEFKPAIPGEFFTSDGDFYFKFLGKTLVRYVNPKRKDTFAANIQVEHIYIAWFYGGKETVYGSVISGNTAERIRNQEAKYIEVVFE